jgi:hypothetical protein
MLRLVNGLLTNGVLRVRRRPVLLAIVAVEIVSALVVGNEAMGFLSVDGIGGYLAETFSGVDIARLLNAFPG